MPDDLPQTFMDVYKSLSGFAYSVNNEAEATEIVKQIIADTSATRVAFAQVSNDIVSAVDDTGVDTVNHPYAADSVLDIIDGAQVGVTKAAFGIAQTGTLVEVTDDDAHRLVSALPRTHIGIVDARDLVPTLYEAAPRLREVFANASPNTAVSFISGPSRTGDIEMILTLGVHGPEHAHAIIITGD